VQTISFFSHLRAKEVYGPFLIIGPLSTLRNWVAEVRPTGSSMHTLQVLLLAVAVCSLQHTWQCCAARGEGNRQQHVHPAACTLQAFSVGGGFV
jgi:hypothetical protein